MSERGNGSEPLIEVKNVCVLHLYEVPDAVPAAPRKTAA